MEFLLYLLRFLYRIRWWLIIAPLVVALVAIWSTRNMGKTYHVDMTIYTGVVSGFAMETGEASQSQTIVNTTIDNIINIIKSKETLQDVSIHLYARHMIYGDEKADNQYIQAANYRHLLLITPKEVLALIDKSSEEETVNRLREYEKASPGNFVYGLFNWNHPFYCHSALNAIRVERLGNSDMLSVHYSAGDPGVAYQTLLLLDKMYVKHYQTLQFGSTNSAIKYFERELERVGAELRANEDSLTNYNVKNRIINYDEQTKQVAALDKEFEMKYQEVMLNLNSANASIVHLEKQLGENAQYLRNNAQFLQKLQEIARLSARISEMETFHNDSTSSSYTFQRIKVYKEQLSKLENEFTKFSVEQSNQRFTREGYPTSNFVTQWLEELMKKEKTTAEIQIMEGFKKELDHQYSHFSPIGSTIKRQERSIDFIERSYLSILSSLNAARLRLKSLEMNSASLKLINPPVFPLNSEPTKRKSLVLAAFVGSIVFILGFFLLIDVLDRTLRDKQRTERITSGKVLGVFPGRERFRRRKYSGVFREIAARRLANALTGFFRPGRVPIVLNFVSTKQQVGKTYLISNLSTYWEEQGLSVKTFSYERDFNPQSKEFLFAKDTTSLSAPDDCDILLVEYPSLSEGSVPVGLLRQADVNLLIVQADQAWEASDQLLLNDLDRLSGSRPVFLCLNRANKEVVEDFTGMLPPYTWVKRLFYKYFRLGLTAAPHS